MIIIIIIINNAPADIGRHTETTDYKSSSAEAIINKH